MDPMGKAEQQKGFSIGVPANVRSLLWSGFWPTTPKNVAWSKRILPNYIALIHFLGIKELIIGSSKWS